MSDYHSCYVLYLYHLITVVELSRVEPDDIPIIDFIESIADSVVESAFSPLPELKIRRLETIAAPKRR